MLQIHNTPATQSQAPASTLTVLHVGSGAYHPDKLHPAFRGWREVRLDVDPGVQPDIIGSITAMTAVPSGSVHAIWSSHNLEHVHAHEVPLALREFHRVLRPEGFALITLPDLQKVAEFVVADRLTATAYVAAAGPIAPLDMIYGHGAAIAAGQTFMAHKTGFTATTLGNALLEAGFAKVNINRSGLDLWALAHKTEPQAK